MVALSMGGKRLWKTLACLTLLQMALLTDANFDKPKEADKKSEAKKEKEYASTFGAPKKDYKSTSGKFGSGKQDYKGTSGKFGSGKQDYKGTSGKLGSGKQEEYIMLPNYGTSTGHLEWILAPAWAIPKENIYGKVETATKEAHLLKEVNELHDLSSGHLEWILVPQWVAPKTTKNVHAKYNIATKEAQFKQPKEVFLSSAGNAKCTLEGLDKLDSGKKTVASKQRPIFIIGHMANSLPEVNSFLEKGANALQTDVRFTQHGTATRCHHGLLCDCFRDCLQETEFTEYLDYMRSITSGEQAKYKDKVSFLLLDLRTEDILHEYKYDAGLDLATKLILHLWKDVAIDDALNVLLYVNSVEDRALLRGVLDSINSLPRSESWKERVGFDFGAFESPAAIHEAFSDLGIYGQRWQGDGDSNCFADLGGDFRLPEIVAGRDGKNPECGYVDKAYAWNIDTPLTIERMIKLGVDGIITNHPEHVIQVIEQDNVADKARCAGPSDSPWVRVITVY
ncbi:dermonecrotic toxin SpeSicTox-betaIB2a-like [Haemaphysalis longicornis]